MHMDVESRRTVLQPKSEFFITVNNSPLWCEDIIFATTTFHMSTESSFETQFTVVLLKTHPENHFPAHHFLQTF